MLSSMGIFAATVSLVLLFFGWELKVWVRHHRVLKREVDSKEARLTQMTQVVEAQMRQQDQQRQTLRQMNTRLIELEGRGRSADSILAAREYLDQGRNLKALVQQGTISQPEAHLMALLHRGGRARRAH